MKEMTIWLVGDLTEDDQWELIDNIEVFSSEDEAKEYAKNHEVYDKWHDEYVELRAVKKTLYFK